MYMTKKRMLESAGSGIAPKKPRDEALERAERGYYLDTNEAGSKLCQSCGKQMGTRSCRRTNGYRICGKSVCENYVKSLPETTSFAQKSLSHNIRGMELTSYMKKKLLENSAESTPKVDSQNTTPPETPTSGKSSQATDTVKDSQEEGVAKKEESVDPASSSQADKKMEKGMKGAAVR